MIKILTLSFSGLIAILFSSFTFGAATAVQTRGQIEVEWTNTASTHCVTNQPSYRIKEYINGTLTQTLYIQSASQKSTVIETPRVVPANTAYGYTVSYFKCLGSGGNYLSAGSTYTLIMAPPIGDRRVIFIHTDLQGSPAAESNERGEITND